MMNHCCLVKHFKYTAGRPGADDRIRQLTEKRFTFSFKNLYAIIFSLHN